MLERATEVQEVLDPVGFEKRLWRAVITQALMDATRKKPNGSIEKGAKDSAIAWLRCNSQHFMRLIGKSFVTQCNLLELTYHSTQYSSQDNPLQLLSHHVSKSNL